MSPSLPGGIRSSQMNMQTLKRPLKMFTSELPSKAEVKVKTQRMNSDRQTEGQNGRLSINTRWSPTEGGDKAAHMCAGSLSAGPHPGDVSSRPGVLHTSTASEGCCIQSHTLKNLFRLKTQRIPFGCCDLRPPQTPRWRNNNNLSASVYISFNPNSNLHLKQLEHDTIKLPDEKTRIRVSTFAYFIPLRR